MVLSVTVTDPDGVPEGVKRVEVVFPGGTIHQLKYNESQEWNRNYLHYIYYGDTSSIEDASNSTGVYTFRVINFNDQGMATLVGVEED